MKKLILLLLVTLMVSQTGICATKQESLRKIQTSNDSYIRSCYAVANGFKTDHKFANYLRGYCSDFEFKRDKVLNMVYPQYIDSVENYYEDRANLVSTLNENQLSTYKTIVSEYCKYNSKKDVSGCKKFKSLD